MPQLSSEKTMPRNTSREKSVNVTACCSNSPERQAELVDRHFLRLLVSTAPRPQTIASQVHDLDRDLPSIRDEMTLMREQAGA